MIDLHVHVYDLDSVNLDMVDEKDLVVQDLYDDQDGYLQYVVDSASLPGRSIEIRVPIAWIKPELIEQLKASYALNLDA